MSVRPVRALLAVLITTLAGLLALTACTSGPAPAPADGGPSSVTVTGYGGRTIELPRQPRVIVADLYSAAALWEYGIRPAGVFGWGSQDGGSGAVDLSTTTVIGLDADFDVEKLAALQPDLIIGFGNTDGTAWTWWDEAVTGRATALAPFVPIQMTGRSVVDIMEDYRSLARQLGGDADGEVITTAVADYEAALDRIERLAADRPRTVLAMSPETGVVYIGAKLVQLDLLRERGVRFAGPPEQTGPWAEVSWENMIDHPADLIMLYTGTEAGVTDSPVYQRMPAVQREQVVSWNDKRPYHYREYADWLTAFADAYEAAEPVTG